MNRNELLINSLLKLEAHINSDMRIMGDHLWKVEIPDGFLVCYRHTKRGQLIYKVTQDSFTEYEPTSEVTTLIYEIRGVLHEAKELIYRNLFVHSLDRVPRPVSEKVNRIYENIKTLINKLQ